MIIDKCILGISKSKIYSNSDIRSIVKKFIKERGLNKDLTINKELIFIDPELKKILLKYDVYKLGKSSGDIKKLIKEKGLVNYIPYVTDNIIVDGVVCHIDVMYYLEKSVRIMVRTDRGVVNFYYRIERNLVNIYREKEKIDELVTIPNTKYKITDDYDGIEIRDIQLIRTKTPPLEMFSDNNSFDNIKKKCIILTNLEENKVDIFYSKDYVDKGGFEYGKTYGISHFRKYKYWLY